MIRFGLLAAICISICGSSSIASAQTAAAPEAMSPEARIYLQSAIDLFKRMHINRDEVSWPEVEARAFERAGTAVTPRDTYRAIQGVIATLGEKHTFLIEAPQPVAQAPAPEGAPTLSSGPGFPTPTGTLVNGHYGMVHLPGFGGSREQGVVYTRALVEPLRAFDAQGVCGWIVDLRNNFGGNMWPMMTGLYPLLGEPPYGFFSTHGEVERQPWILMDGYVGYGDMGPPPEIMPFQLDAGSRPIAVLTDDSSWSSAEALAIAFRTLPNVKFIGQPSGGYVTVNNPQTLSDGAVILMTVGWNHDRTGQRYDDAIQPDIVAPKGQATIDAAVTWLDQQSNCPRRTT